MRIQHLDAPNRCTPAGEFKDNTFTITMEMTARELQDLISACNWQETGMQADIDSGKFDQEPGTKEAWKQTVERAKNRKNVLSVIAQVIF